MPEAGGWSEEQGSAVQHYADLSQGRLHFGVLYCVCGGVGV